MIDHNSLFSRSPDTAYILGQEAQEADTGSDTLYLGQLRTSEILRLDGSAALLWDMLQNPRTLGSLIEEVAVLFELEESEVEEDIGNFIISLLKRGLLEELS